MSETHAIEFNKRTDKKHSVRWDAAAPKGEEIPVGTIYISRPFCASAKRIRVTIEVLE